MKPLFASPVTQDETSRQDFFLCRISRFFASVPDLLRYIQHPVPLCRSLHDLGYLPEERLVITANGHELRFLEFPLLAAFFAKL